MVSEQSDRFDLQKFWDLLGIRCSSEGWPVDKFKNERDWKNSKSTGSTAGQDRVPEDAKESDDEANYGWAKLKVGCGGSEVGNAGLYCIVACTYFYQVNWYFNGAPKAPTDSEEESENSNWNEDFNDDP